MKQYLDILKNIKENGKWQEGRNGRVKYNLCEVFRHDMSKGFPCLTTKKVLFDRVKSELLWFLSGSRFIHDLKALDNNNKIWDANQKDWFEKKGYADGPYMVDMEFVQNLDDYGYCGNIYGYQWRSWMLDKEIAAEQIAVSQEIENLYPRMSIDQIAMAQDMIRTEPESRRIIVNAWEPFDIAHNQMCLPPCHVMHQYVCDGDILNLTMYQRSCDMFLGVPFNIASYGLLLEMMAQTTNKKAGELIIVLNHAHIYEEHMDAVDKQLNREPHDLPKLILDKTIENIDDFRMEHISLDSYNPQSFIKADMKV